MMTAILGKPGQPTNLMPGRPAFSELYVRRAILLARVGRPDDAMRDIDSVVAIGSQRPILRMQAYLRAHGFAGLRIDGKRSAALDDALKACYIDNVCWPGLPQQI
jgi:hypothetical protein